MPEDSRSVRIENIKEIAELNHRCTSSDLLTEIRISQARTEESMISLAAAFQELNAKVEEQTRQFNQVIQYGHDCRSRDEIQRTAAAVEYLKAEIHKQQGRTKYEDRLWNIGQAVFVAALVAVVLFLMKGGAIT